MRGSKGKKRSYGKKTGKVLKKELPDGSVVEYDEVVPDEEAIAELHHELNSPDRDASGLSSTERHRSADEIRSLVQQMLTGKPQRKTSFRKVIAVEGGGKSEKVKLLPKWPMASYSVGVGSDPEAIAKARIEAQAAGVPTDFDKEGRPVFTSRGHRKKYVEKVFQGTIYDVDGGYGDPQRGALSDEIARLREEQAMDSASALGFSDLF